MRFRLMHIMLAVISVTSCQVDTLDLRADRIDFPQYIELQETSQKVLRYDCNGEKISEKMEVIQPAYTAIKIPYVANHAQSSVRVVNLTNNNLYMCNVIDNVLFAGLSSNRSSGCHLLLEEGTNEISLTYLKCPDSNWTATSGIPCSQPVEILETKTVYLHVSANKVQENGHIVKTDNSRCDAHENLSKEQSEDDILRLTSEGLEAQLIKEFLKGFPQPRQ